MGLAAGEPIARSRVRSPTAAEPSTILIALGDPARAGRLARACASRNLLPSLAFTTDQVARYARCAQFDLVLCGLTSRAHVTSTVAAVRRFADPIVVLLDREELPNSELAELGVLAGIATSAADDEVASRIAALVLLHRREVSSEPLRWGPLELDESRRGARWRGESLGLTPIQFKLLVALARARGAVMSHLQLAELVWGAVPVDDGDRVVAHVRRIRAKLEPDPSHPAFLLTARGEGFRLADLGEIEDRRRDDRSPARQRGRQRHRSSGAGRRSVGSGAAQPLREDEVLQAVWPMGTPDVQAEKSRS